MGSDASRKRTATGTVTASVRTTTLDAENEEFRLDAAVAGWTEEGAWATRRIVPSGYTIADDETQKFTLSVLSHEWQRQ